MGERTQAVMQESVKANLRAVHEGSHWAYFKWFGEKSATPEFWNAAYEALHEREVQAAEDLCRKYGVDPLPLRPVSEDRVVVQGRGDVTMHRVTVRNTGERSVKPAYVGNQTFGRTILAS